MQSIARARPLRLCLIGSGAISCRTAQLLAARAADRVEIVAIATRPGSRRSDWWPATARQITDPAEQTGLGADIIVEAASREAVGIWGEAALTAARKFVVCSASALTDDGLRKRFEALAATSGAQLVVGPGALGGVQAISAAALRPLARVTHEIRKPPLAWRGTVAESLCDLPRLQGAETFYRGSAREAAASFPANANSVVITSLAGKGLDETEVALVADPAISSNIHILHATGDFGSFSMTIANEPMPANPKTSDMTALSLVHLLRSETAPLVA